MAKKRQKQGINKQDTDAQKEPQEVPSSEEAAAPDQEEEKEAQPKEVEDGMKVVSNCVYSFHPTGIWPFCMEYSSL